MPDHATPDAPFFTDHEWVAVADGTRAGLAETVLDAARQATPAGLQSVPGRRAGGPNPDVPRAVDPGTAVEQEFTLRVGLHATFGATYELRVTDAGAPVPGLDGALVIVGAEPRLELEQPAAGAPAARAALGVAAHGAASSTVHQPFSPGGGSCATCHSTHSASGANLVKAETQTALCTTCHGASGLGGAADVSAQFDEGLANDVETRSFYRHDLTLPGHTTAKAEVQAGLTTRHSQCSDCHNPHDLTAAPEAYDPATATWTPPGALSTRGLRPVWGAAGETPTYEVLDGSLAKVDAEQQVCYACHSGNAAQLPNDPGRPSRDRTDVAKAFNPANLSFHPVEAPGRNQTAKMADSLSGYSPYRMWALTPGDTVRCTQCHTSSSTPAGADPAGSLPVHASANRGILVRPYENRNLPPRGQYRLTANFALCLTCHAQAPFTTVMGAGAQTATNFDWHGRHVAGISLYGSGGTDIDTAGDGQGNALCAECHFRTHGTTDAVPGQSVSGEGIVSFAPNVVGSRLATNKTPTFVRTDVGGSCTLTCHGKDHQGTVYVRPTG